MNIESKQLTRKGPADRFNGDVYIDAIGVRKPEPSRMACGCVHFTPGARTAWQSHAVGQTRYVTEGIALLGTRDGTVIVARPGQACLPPGSSAPSGSSR
jgi:quercetin dioxygenase-like cupin family protein